MGKELESYAHDFFVPQMKKRYMRVKVECEKDSMEAVIRSFDINELARIYQSFEGIKQFGNVHQIQVVEIMERKDEITCLTSMEDWTIKV